MQTSLIIPNYNGITYLKDCLDSIFRQSFRHFEVIVVDNASTDESCQLILENYPQVKLIKNSQNLGFSAAVNQGIRASGSEFVVLLNNDTEVEEDWLQSLVSCIEKDEKIFSASSKMVRFNERNVIDDAGDEFNLLGWAYKRGDGVSIEKYSRDEEIFSSCGGASIYRKKVFDEIGYFDENFFAYMEDLDVSYRAKIYGYKNVYCSGALVYHIGSATSGSKYNSFKVKLAIRNNIFVLFKNMPILQLIINLPFLVIGWLIKAVFFSLKGFAREYFAGTYEGMANVRKLQKVKYFNKNFKNYVKIEFNIIVSTFKYALMKVFKLDI